MLCHWRYVLDNLFGEVESVSCLGAMHVPECWDENNEPYEVTADDAAYATFELAGGIVAQINSSWCVRVNRDELFGLQVDGTQGSAVAGLNSCSQSSLSPERRGFPEDLRRGGAGGRRRARRHICPAADGGFRSEEP